MTLGEGWDVLTQVRMIGLAAAQLKSLWPGASGLVGRR